MVLIAAVLVLGASAWMSWLIVPTIFAVVLAVALHPLAARLERLGLGRVASSVACTGLVALALLGVAIVVTAQAGAVIRDSDRYLERLGALAAESFGPIRDSGLVQAVTEATGEASDADRDSGTGAGDGEESESETSPGIDPEGGAVGMATAADSKPSVGDEPRPSLAGASRGTGRLDDLRSPDPDLGSTAYWRDRITENADTIGGWIARGVGGAIGLFGQAVVLLFLVLYMLNSRTVWTDRIRRAADALGMRFRRGDMDRMGSVISRWTWGILARSVGYGVLIGGCASALGWPHGPLWGVLTATLVLIPYFGPLLAGLLLVLVAVVEGQGWGPPLVMAGLFAVLQFVEGVFIHPRLYGRTAHFDSLTVLLGVLVFGFLWGPLGFIAALPVLVLVRGFVEATPGSEAIAALLGDEVA